LKITLPYGKETISFSVEEQCEVYTPKKIQCDSSDVNLSDAFTDPIAMPSLEEFIRKTRKLLVIVNDGTRPSLTPDILSHIHPVIRKHSNAQFLIATGAHLPPDESGLYRIFGDLLPHLRDRIVPHRAKEEGELIFMGTTSRGTEVSFNRRVLESDGIICIGNVKSHYFAGFAGGRKSFLPGVAGYGTIETNHSHAVEEGSQPMMLKGNPLAEDMEEGVRMLGDKRIFSIQTVVDQEHKLAGAYCGELFGSFERAVERTREIFEVPMASRGNIIISVNPYPMDINLYQSQHALENVKQVVEEGGITILVSRCWGGVGNPAYLELLDRGRTLEGVERILGEGYRLGYHKALRFMKMKENSELWAVTGLDDEVIRRSLMKPYNVLRQAVNDAIRKVKAGGREPRIKVFPYGGMTVPCLRKI